MVPLRSTLLLAHGGDTGREAIPIAYLVWLYGRASWYNMSSHLDLSSLI